MFARNSSPSLPRRKEEAEEKRSKAKKARMGFMKMLAQNTQIDGRSRWDEAERTLRDDARFKAVPDSSDREDLFNEFVEALTKKEKVKQRLAVAGVVSPLVSLPSLAVVFCCIASVSVQAPLVYLAQMSGERGRSEQIHVGGQGEYLVVDGFFWGVLASWIPCIFALVGGIAEVMN